MEGHPQVHAPTATAFAACRRSTSPSRTSAASSASSTDRSRGVVAAVHADDRLIDTYWSASAIPKRASAGWPWPTHTCGVRVDRMRHNPNHIDPGQRLYGWRVATVRMTSENLALKSPCAIRKPRSEASPTNWPPLARTTASPTAASPTSKPASPNHNCDRETRLVSTAPTASYLDRVRG